MLQDIFDELNRPFSQSEIPRRIELCKQALEMISKEEQPRQWGMLQDDLGSSLMQATTGRRFENIEWAIRYFEHALEVRTPQTDSKRWALTEHNLAGAYYKRILGERVENLEEAIHHAQRALQVSPREEFKHFYAQVLNTLGEIYRVRIRESRMDNIEHAIQLFAQALEVHTREGYPEDWAMVHNNLAIAYSERILGERAENIEQSIYHAQQALEVRTHAAHPEQWAMTQYNLGNAYRFRIRVDQTENIEQSIYHFEQARKVHTQRTFPEDWARIQNNLGNAYLARIRGERVNNIERAIIHYQQALKIHTEQTSPENWAQAQNNLGNAYQARIRGKPADNIEESIRCYRSALKVRTREAFSQDWAQTLNNLAGVERARASENIEQSIQHLQQTLGVYTRETFPQNWAGTQNNLAIAYTDRIQGEQAENIDEAIHYYQQALEVYTHDMFPDLCLKTARSLGNLVFEHQRWELARDAYDIAFGAQDVLMQASFSRAGKQIELSEVRNLHPRAAYANVQLGNVERAVEVLEQGRAQLLRESLERRRQDLKKLPELGFKSLYDDYTQAMDQYEKLQESIRTSQNIRSGDWMSEMDKALKKVQDATTAIREIAGQSYPQYHYFQQALRFDEIQKQALEKPLVYLCSTSAGGLALVVTKRGVHSFELPALNQVSLQKQIWRPSDEEIDRINTHLKQGKITPEDIEAVNGGYFSVYALWSLSSYLLNTSQELKLNLFNAWQKTLDDTAHWLWDVVMGELVTELKKYSKSVVLIPAGQLALLPLHASWTVDTVNPKYRRYALDDLNISYVPSAHALWQASLATKRPVESLMIVDNPDGTLVFSKDEVHAALDVFKQARHLPGKKATLTVVKEEIQKAHVLHFSTHGRAGWEKAEQARLKLADDSYLTLPDIFELDLNKARLAVLSACETGVPGLELIDEMIGLPAGMMQAGVPGVVGSLWSVNDGSTAVLMTRFYRFWRKEGRTPQEALRLSQIWLRDSLFESPYYWAAFTYTGV